MIYDTEYIALDNKGYNFDDEENSLYISIAIDPEELGSHFHLRATLFDDFIKEDFYTYSGLKAELKDLNERFNAQIDVEDVMSNALEVENYAIGAR